METKSITLKKKYEFWLGDKFYKVEEQCDRYNKLHSKIFESNCPSCNNTRKITYKGHDGKDYETECPICKGCIGHGRGNRIVLSNWQVHEYIVHKIRAQGPETVSAYKDGVGYVDSVTLTAFCKIGRCMDDYIETNVPFFKDKIDPDLSRISVKDTSQGLINTDFVFRSKKEAEKFCSMLKEYDKNRLAEFNRTYGVEHEYPF